MTEVDRAVAKVELTTVKLELVAVELEAAPVVLNRWRRKLILDVGRSKKDVDAVRCSCHCRFLLCRDTSVNGSCGGRTTTVASSACQIRTPALPRWILPAGPRGWRSSSTAS